MNRIFQKILLFIFLSITPYSGISAKEQGYTWSITPPLFEKIISPGEQISFTIFLHNHGKDKVNLIGSIKSLTMESPGGSLEFVDDHTLPHSCQGWMRINPISVIVAPKEEREIKVQIDVPKKIEGGYYASIFFQPVEQTFQTTGNAVSFSLRMGTMVALRFRRTQNIDVVILSFNAVNEEDCTLFRVVLHNRGNVHVSPETSVVIMSEDNRVVDRLKYKEKSFILPDSEKRFQLV